MHDFTLAIYCALTMQQLSDGGGLLDAFANGLKLLLTFFIFICNETITKGFNKFPSTST